MYQDFVRDEMEKLTGIKRASTLPMHEEVDQAWARYRAFRNSKAGEDGQGSGESEMAEGSEEIKLLPRLDECSTHLVNQTLINGVIDLVYKEAKVRTYVFRIITFTHLLQRTQIQT